MHDLGPFLFKAAHKRPKYLHFVLQKNCHSRLFTEVIYFDLTLPWGKKHYNSQFVGESIKQQHCYGSALPLLSKAMLGKTSTPKFLPSECPSSWVHLNSGMGPNCRIFTCRKKASLFHLCSIFSQNKPICNVFSCVFLFLVCFPLGFFFNLRAWAYPVHVHGSSEEILKAMPFLRG